MLKALKLAGVWITLIAGSSLLGYLAGWILARFVFHLGDEKLVLQCTEPKVAQFTFHAKRIERDDNTYIITGKDGVVVRFEKSAYAYCLVVPEKEGG